MVLTKQFLVPNSELGNGKVLLAYHPVGPLAAVTGIKGRVIVMNRQGTIEHQFSLPGVISMQWDYRSDTLALITESAQTVTLYNHRARKSDTVETGLSHLCFLKWSRAQPFFAVGTKGGQWTIYNRATLRKVSAPDSKHAQAIIGGAWTLSRNLLVLASADRVLSVSDAEGTEVATMHLAGKPQSLVLCEVGGKGGYESYAVASFGSAVQVVNLQDFSSAQAQFDPSLGAVTAVCSGPRGLALVGFASGTVGVMNVTGEEIALKQQFRCGKEAVSCLTFSESNGLCAALCANRVQLLITGADAITETGETEVLPSDIGNQDTMQWSVDGQHLGFTTTFGFALSLGMRVLSVNAACGSLIFSLVSGQLVAVKNVQSNTVVCTIPIDVEPAFMAAGMGILAVGSGNKVHYYEYYIPNALPGSHASSVRPGGEEEPREPSSKLLRVAEYAGQVTEVRVNSAFAAVLYDGRLQLHRLRESEVEATSRYFPESGDTKVVAVGLSEPLLLYATTSKVSIYALHNLQQVAGFSCATGLTRAYPNPTCTRVAYIDDSNQLFNLNPVTEVANQAEGYEPDFKTILWDQADPTVFVAHDGSQCITFVNAPHSRHGATCESVLVKESSNSNLYTPLSPDFKPVSLFRGTMICQSSAGVLENVLLRSHFDILARVPNPEAFYNNFSLNRLRWSSNNISSKQEAEDLAVKALHMLDIELAIRVYRQLEHPSLVLCLEKIRHVHEKNLLLGHVSMIMGYLKDAQNFFLRSSQPLCALDMRRDMMQWDRAILLAEKLAPEQVPVLSKEFAQQLEYRGDYVKALEMYKNGKREIPRGHSSTELTVHTQQVQAHNALCEEGVARCYIRTGNVDGALAIANESSNSDFVRECAKLCEENRKFEEAAQLFEKSGDAEKAATLFIERCKNLKAAGRLIPQIKSRNIIGLFAKGKEAEGSYAEAEKVYVQAEDWDNAVRLKLEKLNDLHGAYVIVRQTKSANAASMVAKSCQRRKEYGTAVEFLVLAKCYAEAFESAKEHDCMFNFESALLGQVQLKDGVAPVQYQPDFLKVADYYEDAGKPANAAQYFQIAGNFPKALKKYLEAGDPECIEKAVDVVGKAHSDALTNKLIDFLMGESDGEPKDPTYIFKLYLALGSYEKAAKTAVIIASKEQEMGNYKRAHDTLVQAYRILREKKIRVPSDLRRTLMLLHSYIIVKDLIKTMKDEACSCRMLLRVSRNIQKFPKHIVTIVTSTVLQCAKSGFKKSAFDYACFLVQNEKYRAELAESAKKKVEGIVRRRGKEEMEDPVEATAPCPFCAAPVLETELECGACKNSIPFCVVTGKHIIKSDYTITPCCKFPAIYSALVTRVRETPSCPMCNSSIDVNAVERDSDPDLKEFL